jgi:tetratricopeptide (TPR) repeat protein
MTETSDSITNEDWDTLHEAAYRAFDDGRLAEAAHHFATMLSHDRQSSWAYMLGLAHKYMRDWSASLAANREAIALADEPNEGAIWNAAIAATALGEWAQARALWTQYGVKLSPDDAPDSPIEGRFGLCCVRLNPWSDGETLFAQRIDPARAVLVNVPLPESGHRWGDIVLNDGACTGEREHGDGTVPVFNALQCLQRSEFETFAVFVGAETETDLEALLEIKLPGLGNVEDWTDSIRHLCLRCSYGTPHQNRKSHESDDIAANDAAWDPERNLGIAAQSRHTVDRLLALWTAGGNGRWVEAIAQRDVPLTEPAEGQVWWRSRDEDVSDEDNNEN